MTGPTINRYSRDRSDMMAYLNGLVDDGRALLITEAAEALHMHADRIKEILRSMQQAGALTVETKNSSASRRYRIVFPDGRATTWPVVIRPAQARPRTEEIDERREHVEQTRAATRRYWLERERAPRRPAERVDFMDKATVLALQGVFHG